jgi:hypothetical protein
MPPVQAASLSDVSVFFVEVVLPVLGVLLLVMTFAMVLFKFGEPYKDHIQHIQAFGVDLRISIVTLFVLVAVALSLTGAFFLYRNYEQQLASLRDMPKRVEDAEKSYKLALAQAKQIDVVALVTLGDTDPKHTPPPEALRCRLFLNESREYRDVNVRAGITSDQYFLVLDNLTADTRIRRLECRDRDGVTWDLREFNPLAPEYELHRAR